MQLHECSASLQLALNPQPGFLHQETLSDQYVVCFLMWNLDLKKDMKAKRGGRGPAGLRRTRAMGGLGDALRANSKNTDAGLCHNQTH